jgi:hypothetical protein
MQLRNSVAAEILQLVLAVGTHWMWGRSLLVKDDSWIGTTTAGVDHFTMAGWWYAFVSLSIFRFMLFRWYFRTFIWYRVLWQISRMNLRLDALHPHRCAGIGFLANAPTIFTPLLLAHSFLLVGLVQNKIWHEGYELADFKIEIAMVAAFSLLLAITPLFFFMSKLVTAKRRGGAEYGALASSYVAAFRDKWLEHASPGRGDLIGSADIQSLADLSSAYDAVRETRFAPVTRQTIMQLIVVIALPLLPLALNVIPYEEVLIRLAGFVF